MKHFSYQHWALRHDNNNIIWLSLDRKNSSTNTLNEEVLLEFQAILHGIKHQPLKGLIILSAKANGFIAGADIEAFKHLETQSDAFHMIRGVQKIFNELASLPFPTLALIHGFCLGGGLELALACDYRIAEDSPHTRIGLPEVKLGIHPGWGGTVRLPQVVGPLKSMELILSGRILSAHSAQKMGLVSLSLPKRELERAAIALIDSQGTPLRPPMGIRLLNRMMLRPLVAALFYHQLKSKVKKSHYPAPYAVVRNWLKYGIYGKRAMQAEARSVARLIISPTARQLVRVFFLQEKMKSLSKASDFKAKHLHVIGAGTMGGDIAAWAVLQGLTVTLQDREARFIAPAIGRAYALFKEKLKLPFLIREAMDRLLPDLTGKGISQADVIIEAIVENKDIKQKLFQSLEPHLKPRALLATNTSSLKLEEIAEGLTHPERLVGIHFFNPVAKMPLVEVVHGKATETRVQQDALAFVGALSKLPLSVQSSPGFLVNRVLVPYLLEAMSLYEEGVSPKAIDRAAENFGMPMGPMALADTVGLDICLAVANNFMESLGGEVPPLLKQMVEAGHLGKKSGEGFYYYKKGKATRPVRGGHKGKADMTDRLILRMVNEAIACLHERIVESEELLDAGMIFGTGFAPFRGGPLQYVKDRGVKKVMDRLNTLATLYGKGFEPGSGWELLQTRRLT
ncbi:MAG TPA: 3-hydroxyacyl-CoA dehydrogenase NAD-binding domain-containing protein [Coxiellaceae bacterium]|nr:3-hydroxyacyl-CoA dehydrogenase NAD-binding domain-containing protein [Coxiellaceae bacterium]